MPNTFQFEILTPDKVFYSATISSLVAPQMEGYFGVLAHHAPLIARSSGGKLKIREDSQAEKFFTVGSGIVEVLNNRVIFFTRQVQTTSAEPKP